MKVITLQLLIGLAIDKLMFHQLAGRFLFFNNRYKFKSEEAKAVWSRLSKLDKKTATLPEVVKAVGNADWCNAFCNIKCNECGLDALKTAIVLGEEAEPGSRTVILCQECVANAIIHLGQDLLADTPAIVEKPK